MRCGRLWPAARTSAGSGWPNAVELVRSSPTLSGIVAKPPVLCCGHAFRRHTRKASCTRTSGRRMRLCCLPSGTEQRAKATARPAIPIKPHIERFNNILRQRLGRFVRRTLSFSKTDQMHEMCLLLFLHQHNKNCSI